MISFFAILIFAIILKIIGLSLFLIVSGANVLNTIQKLSNVAVQSGNSIQKGINKTQKAVNKAQKKVSKRVSNKLDSHEVANTAVSTMSTAVDVSSKAIDLTSKGIDTGAKAVNIASNATNVAVRVSSVALKGVMWVINIISDILFASTPIIIIIGVIIDIMLMVVGSSYLLYIGIESVTK